jgi:hypothetical protein
MSSGLQYLAPSIRSSDSAGPRARCVSPRHFGTFRLPVSTKHCTTSTVQTERRECVAACGKDGLSNNVKERAGYYGGMPSPGAVASTRAKPLENGQSSRGKRRVAPRIVYLNLRNLSRIYAQTKRRRTLFDRCLLRRLPVSSSSSRKQARRTDGPVLSRCRTRVSPLFYCTRLPTCGVPTYGVLFSD